MSQHIHPESMMAEPKSKVELKDVVFRSRQISLSESPAIERPKLSKWKRVTIVLIISEIALTMTFSSTAIFSATEEIARDFSTTRATIDLVNATAFIVMGSTSFFWAPLSQFLGRKICYNTAILLLLVATIGTACSRGFGFFFATRVLAGCAGTYLFVAGQTIISDCFAPTQRGLATGCLMVGALFGPALGPCIGGLVVTYKTWRVIFWIQTGMAALGLASSVMLIPRIEQAKKLQPFKLRQLARFNPFCALSVLLNPNILLASISSGLLGWLQYALLVSPRHLINPRFNFTTPLVSGLFYISPGFGHVLGALLGGKFADLAVVKGIRKRNGLRLPQDRLNFGTWAFFVIVPVACLIYGWTLDFEVGGLVCPTIAAFFYAMGVTFAFSALNTYCAEALPEQATQVIMTKYFVQYLFGAGATASTIPMIERIGAGLTYTICTVLVIVAGLCVISLLRYGVAMDNWIHKEVSDSSDV